MNLHVSGLFLRVGSGHGDYSTRDTGKPLDLTRQDPKDFRKSPQLTRLDSRGFETLPTRPAGRISIRNPPRQTRARIQGKILSMFSQMLYVYLKVLLLCAALLALCGLS